MVSGVSSSDSVRPQQQLSSDSQQIDSEIKRLQQQLAKVKKDKQIPEEEKRRKVQQLEDRIKNLQQKKLQGDKSKKMGQNQVNDSDDSQSLFTMQNDKQGKKDHPHGGLKHYIDELV